MAGTPKKRAREPFDWSIDKIDRQPVNDIIPYFVFRHTTTIGNERYYAGYQIPEIWLAERIENVFIFHTKNGVLKIPAGLVQFVDHEGKSWDTV